MRNDIINIICGVLGVAFMTISRMQSLKTDIEKANQEFVPMKYFKKEMMGIISSFLSIAIWFFLFGEVAVKYPALSNFTRCSFVVFGAIGAWVLQKALGKTKGWIRNVVDSKTDQLNELKGLAPGEKQ